MNSILFKLLSRILAVGLVAASMQARAQTGGPNIQVLVHGIHFGGQVIYRYQVKNNSASSIDLVTLGVPEEGKDLPGVPWTLNPSLSDVPTIVPQSQCKPFAYMTCAVGVYHFDYMPSPRAVIHMQGSELTQSPPPAVFSGSEFIKPGTLSSVAEVYVPTRDPGYLRGYASVRLFNNHPKDSSGKPITLVEVPFSKSDLVPPSISGSASALKAGGMLDVRVNLQVNDSVDPAPQVVLVSVTANEPLRSHDVRAAVGTDTRSVQLKPNRGRIYYLTYRAIDGSENANSVVISVSGERR